MEEHVHLLNLSNDHRSNEVGSLVGRLLDSVFLYHNKNTFSTSEYQFVFVSYYLTVTHLFAM